MHELDSSGSPTVTYIADASGNIMAVQRGGIIYHYHYNAHGDVVAITRDDGTVKARFSYDSWGAPTEYDSNGQVVDLGTWANTPGNGLFLLFGGMLYDAAAGLYLTKTRAYNPKTGRFLQRDILDESGKSGVYGGFPFGRDAIGTNLYAWCGNNPVNKVDPTGMAFELPGLWCGPLVSPIVKSDGQRQREAYDQAGSPGEYASQAAYGGYDADEVQRNWAAAKAAAEAAEARRVWEEMRQKFNSQSTASANAGLQAIKHLASLGGLDLTTANAIYNSGRGKIDVTVPASSISGLGRICEGIFDENGEYSMNLWFNPDASMNDRLVYGTITLENLGNGNARIKKDKYDFDQTPNGFNPLRWLRNAGTALGESYAYYSGDGVYGSPYDIKFSGTVPVVPCW